MSDGFDSITHGFCEKQLYGSPPEYINSFTSLGLGFAGLTGLFGSSHSNILTKLIFCMLTFNGISSFGYHWTNHKGWRLMDELSMLMLAQSALISIMLALSPPFSLNELTKRIIFSTTLLFSSSFIIMVAIATIFDKTLIFRLAFGFVLAVIIFGSIFVLRLEKRDVDIYGLLGICLIIGSSILWLITEGMCPAVPWMKYIPGHGMWHIGLACGGFLLTEYYTFILAKDFGRYAKLSLGPCGIPLVDYHALQLDNTYISFFEDDDDDYKKTDLITAPYGT